MPYKQITQLPGGMKDTLPKHAQEIYKEAFNSAEEQYGEESHEKNEKGNWVHKQLSGFRFRLPGHWLLIGGGGFPYDRATVAFDRCLRT